MIVIGADTHKQSRTCVAANAPPASSPVSLPRACAKPGFRQLLDWGREPDRERIWAIEDCRHVSGGLSASWSFTASAWSGCRRG